MFNNICHLEYHIYKFMNASSWMLARSVKQFLWVLQMLKSSAYSDAFNSCSFLVSSTTLISAVHTRKISGQSIKPCGTPEILFDQFPVWVLTKFLY